MKTEIKKLYYSITEVAALVGEEQHVLRYWEREFSQLKPQKNRAGNRVYTVKDVEMLKVLRRLLRIERYTVLGAKEYLKLHDIEQEIASEKLVHETNEVSREAVMPADTEKVEKIEKSVKNSDENENSRELRAKVATELRTIAKDLRDRVKK